MAEHSVQVASFWQRGADDPGRVAIIDQDGSSVSYGALLQASNRLSNGWAGTGLRPGDKVAALLPNSRAVFEVCTAALQSGLYYVPMNFHLTAEEVRYILEDSEAAVLVASAEFAEVATAAATEAGLDPDRCLAVGGPIDGFIDYQAFMAGQPIGAPKDRRPGQPMYYTSGTTGRPKGVRRDLSHGDVDVESVQMSQRAFAIAGLDDGVGGVHLVTGPTYHAAPLMCGLAGLHLGQTVVLMGKWSAEDTLRLIEEHHVTGIHLVPTMFHRLLQLPEPVRGSYDVSSLRRVAHAAAPCPIDTKRKVLDWLGPIVHEYYGASEGGGTSVTPEEWLARPGTVGRAYPGASIKILDEAGNELPPGVPGAVYLLMWAPFDYHNDTEKTAASRRGNYFTVGDIGYLDEEQYLFLCDRRTDIIISGGVNIYTAEVEAVLLSHPSVGDAAVFGVPNEEWGEEVKAAVQTVPGIPADDSLAHALIDHCRQNLAHYKCPKSVDFVYELPRLDNGKLYKRRLKEPYWSGRERRI